MSGSAGGNRITRMSVENTVQDYIQKVLSKFPGFKKAKATGSYNAGTKQDFGDIDLIVQIEGTDKKLIKQDLAKYFSTLPDSLIVPFKSDKYKGKKSLSSGELVTVLYPIAGMPDQYVQIDNIISVSEEESTFKNTFLDYSAEVQGLLLGLAKVICLEEDPQEIFKRLGIKNIPPLELNQEYEFNLSGVGLTLRVVTLDNFKEVDRTDVWKSSNWNTVKRLFDNYNIDSDFKTLLKDLSSKLKNERSKNRIKGIFKSMVSIKSGEVGTPKGDNKQIALDAVDSVLENMLFKGLVKELIMPLLEDESQETIAIYPGKFKPPHKGHFDVAKQLLNKADKIIIAISDKEVEGISAKQSKAVWELYNTLLGGKLDIKIIQGSPVKYILDTIEANQNIHYIAVYGKGEESRYRGIGKDSRYMNAEIFDGGTSENEEGNINASDLRVALANSEDISKFLPKGITPDQYEKALGMDEVVNESTVQPPSDFKEALKSLTKYMIDQGMNIKPLPRVISISNDSKNAENILGKTAHYNPNNCSITLYTLNRHPKDILRSYAHEMIHRMQDNEGILKDINTTNTNEDDILEELEKEAYLKGNITFRNWEDSIKNPKPLNEWIIESDLPKFNPPALLTTDLVTQLYKLKINEILLSPNNAVEIEGNIFNGKFKVGDINYDYSISKFQNPYKDGDFYNINFGEIENKNSNLQTGKAGGKNYIKILSTMYKIILDFVSKEKPNYIGISDIEGSGYGNVYNNLTKTNKLPGYSRKDAKVNFITKDSENRNINGSFVVLKKVQSGESESLNEGRYDTISNRTSSMIFNKWKQDFEKGKKQGTFKTFIKNDDMEFDLEAIVKFTNSGKLIVDGGLLEKDDGFKIFVDFEVNKNDLPQKWSDISMGLKDVIRHEIEHITQVNPETSKFMKDDQNIRGLIDAKLLSPSRYFKLEKEVDANLQGMYFRAKKEKRPFIDVINDYLDKQDITPEQKEEIMTLWRSRIKALSLPKF